MNLQQELYDARTHHINLHVEYAKLKSMYEKLVNFTEDEWRLIEKFGLCDSVNKKISKFWDSVEYITTAFFDILELLEEKDNIEKSISVIWKSQVLQRPTNQFVPNDEVVPSTEDSSSVPGCLEYMKSQLTELKGRIKWVEYNVMKYKFASTHGVQLKTNIDKTLKRRKKPKIWRLLSRFFGRNSKLDEEVKWYRKNLEFFQEDVERITSVHRGILRRCLSTEAQKRFPSRCVTIENALRGIPTNYKGSWIEGIKYSAATENILIQQSKSGSELKPTVSSGIGGSSSRIDSIAAFSGIQFFSRYQTNPEESKNGSDGTDEGEKSCEIRKSYKQIVGVEGTNSSGDDNVSNVAVVGDRSDKMTSICSRTDNSVWSVERSSRDTEVMKSQSQNLFANDDNEGDKVDKVPSNPFETDEGYDVAADSLQSANLTSFDSRTDANNKFSVAQKEKEPNNFESVNEEPSEVK